MGAITVIEELRRLVKHSGIFGVSIVLSKTVGFIMIPIYTRCLSPGDYGILEMLDLITFFASIFAALGIYSAVFRFYSAYDSDEDKKEVISTALAYYTLASVALAVAMSVCSGWLAHVILGNYQYAALVRIVSVTLFFSNITEVPVIYLRVREQSVAYGLVGIAKTVLNSGLMILALVLMKRGVYGAVCANLASNAIIGVCMFALTVRAVRLRFASGKLFPMLKYGAPLIFQSLASFILVFSDRFFLRHFANLAEVGVYSLGYKFAAIVTLLVSGPFSFAWQWQQFELAKRPDAKEIQAKIQTYQMFASVGLGLGVSLFAKDALHVLAPATYWAAASVVPIIVLSYVLDNVRTVVLSGLLVQRMTHHLAWISAVVAAANLTLNYVLIGRYFAIGAAVATALSYGLSLFLCYRAAQRVYHIRFEYGRNGITFAVAIALYLVSANIELSFAVSLLLHVFLMAVFLGVLAKMLEPDEKSMFRELGRNIRDRLVSVTAGLGRRLQHARHSGGSPP